MPVPSSPSRDDIDGIAAWTVIRAARELARRLAVELAPLDLSPVEFGVLAQLAAADGLSQADLSRAVGVRPQSMTTLVTSLIARALIDRAGDPGRGRHSNLTLTAAGRALLTEAWPLVVASERWFGDSPDRAATVASTLHPLLHHPAQASGPPHSADGRR